MKTGEALSGLSCYLISNKEYRPGENILPICGADILLQPILGFSSGSQS